MTTREIVGTFKEIYDANVSPSLISKVNNAVLLEQVDPLARTIGLLPQFHRETVNYFVYLPLS